MRNVALAVVATLTLAACPHTGQGPANPTTTSPYDTARIIIQGAQLSLFVADGTFEAWCLTQTDVEKVKQARIKYNHVRMLIVDGLKLALDGVAIAEQAHNDPDIQKLLAQADKAWQDLRVFLVDLLGKSANLNSTLAPTIIN